MFWSTGPFVQKKYFIKTVSADIDIISKLVFGLHTLVFIHFQDEGGFKKVHMGHNEKSHILLSSHVLHIADMCFAHVAAFTRTRDKSAGFNTQAMLPGYIC